MIRRPALGAAAAGLIALLIGGLALLWSAGAASAQEHDAEVEARDLAISAPPKLAMPVMDSARGRVLFVDKGCITCHAVNGVGGDHARVLDADTMEPFASPFELAARMWATAPAMIAAQEEVLGKQIELSGEELGDIIAFLYDAEEQRKLKRADIPPAIAALMEHKHDHDKHARPSVHARTQTGRVGGQSHVGSHGSHH